MRLVATWSSVGECQGVKISFLKNSLQGAFLSWAPCSLAYCSHCDTASITALQSSLAVVAESVSSVLVVPSMNVTGSMMGFFDLDPVADDEVKFLQVGRWPVLQHAVAVETVLTVVKAFGDLKRRRDLGFLLQGEGHQFVSDAVLLVAVSVRRLRATQGRKPIRDAPAHMITNGTLGLESRSPTEILVITGIFSLPSLMAVWYLGSGRSPMNLSTVIHTARAAWARGHGGHIYIHQSMFKKYLHSCMKLVSLPWGQGSKVTHQLVSLVVVEQQRLFQRPPDIGVRGGALEIILSVVLRKRKSLVQILLLQLSMGPLQVLRRRHKLHPAGACPSWPGNEVVVPRKPNILSTKSESLTGSKRAFSICSTISFFLRASSFSFFSCSASSLASWARRS
ncbi:hypothetical protein EYF80_012069 [Liparis tanakae]|uniref:Uncharacterized protein n=1 Tax=Liparis tanakae TaxID=230148 RepID=A0A4Z2IJ42_9TELE|nr:hypothetical protein EYF80_012069 [Liparis tanakae]